MAASGTYRSKRQRALELCRELLDDLDSEKIRASTAVQRLWRIATLIRSEQTIERAQRELSGYPNFGSSLAEATTYVLDLVEEGRLEIDVDVDTYARQVFRQLPGYRILELEALGGFGSVYVRMWDPISKYEELLERVRKDTKRVYRHLYDSGEALWSASELNKLVSGVKQWVYREASQIEERLEFGQIPAAAMETTFEFVDAELLKIVPTAAERLIAAYRNLAEKSKENWVNVADTCRRVIKDFADALYPPHDGQAHGLDVSDSKYLNRIRAFIKDTIESRRVRDQMESVLGLLGEMLARTDNLASRSVHQGELSRFEVERILIYTYLAIGDTLTLSGYGQRKDASTARINLNQASCQELQTELGLSAQVAAEIVKVRKYREFGSWQDVAEVKGIGPKTLERIRTLSTL